MEFDENDRVVNMDKLKARAFDMICDMLNNDNVGGQTIVNAVIIINELINAVDESGRCV